MNKIVFVVIAVAILVGAAFFVVVLPGLSILGDEGYKTQSKWYECYQGNPNKELLLPEDRKGFITSHRNDLDFGLSETITIAGNYNAQMGLQCIHKCKYIVKWKANPGADWKIVSRPGFKEDWITVKNPGNMIPTHSTPGYRTVDPYVFNIRGQREGAIRVEFWGYFDPHTVVPWDTWVWKMLSSDQAMLASGVCGMWLPKRDDGGYQSTFEIGETVRIKVETGVGAPDVDVDARADEKTWELHLKRPDGTEYTDQNFPRQLADHYKGEVTFEIYEDMFTLGGNNRYELELYNVLWKKGTLELSSIDILAKKPDEPVISPDCGMSVEVPATVRVDISASPNEETQLPITQFGVMVWYGKYSNLAPGSWGDDRWILRETMITASNNKATFDFDVSSPNRWFTIIAYAHDEEDRDSHTEYYQIQTYESGEDPPDDEDLEDEGGGQGSYGGGTSGETTPWDFWETPEPIDYTMLIVALVVFFAALFIGLLAPIPGGLYGKAAVIIAGVIAAILIYLFL